MMNRIYILLLVVCFATACKKDNYLVFNEVDRLQFGPVPEKIYLPQSAMEDTLKAYTFLTQPISRVRDTMYFDLYTMGNVSKVDRLYKIEQELVKGAGNAEPGLHYVPFNDPAVRNLYTIPANSNHVKVPVILLKDASLQTAKYTLKLKVSENENFKTGDVRKTWRKLIIADILIKPAAWNDRVLGTYSQVKHRFMIQQTGLDWDQAYIVSVNSDVTLTYYWQAKFRELLYNYNNDPDNEDGPLTDEFEKEVTF
ncbi:DUF4843 domain-containing protein [Pedobacter nyackensis]|uniref:DUF4843 domain-containing protein n=1 Tax=Pedobacter nyackensis TaxID=475255 RepID=UPI00292E549A|nr:DUF4843 domain-containing protein [Pedobacter nyackensis]